MEAVADNRFLTLTEVAKSLPTRPHINTLERWIRRGVRGQKLEATRIGGRVMIGAEALKDFLSRLNGGSAGAAAPAPSRKRAMAEANAVLDAAGI